MGRVYRVPFNGTVTLAGTDFSAFYISPATNKPCRLRGFRLGQTSEVGDAAEEGIRLSLRRLPATVTAPSGGSIGGVTPVAADGNDGAAGFTARALDSTPATTTGTAVILEEIGWNVRASPMEFWFPDPDLMPRVQNGEALELTWQTTVADDISVQGVAYIEEL